MDRNIKLTIRYKYRIARVDQHFMVLPRQLCQELHKELTRQAGDSIPDNHTTFGFIDVGFYEDEFKQGKEIYVQFSDAWARFGYAIAPFD